MTSKDNLKRVEVLDWAEDHGFIINPSKGYDHYVQYTQKYGACPCDGARTHCPCPESIKEVQEQGFCLCRLYWRDFATFKKTLKVAP